MHGGIPNYLGLLRRRAQTYQQDADGLATIVREYTYDGNGQLKTFVDKKYPEGTDTCSGTTVIEPDGGACLPAGEGQRMGSAASYTYDKVGNRTDLGANTATGNRLMEFDGYQFTYDADGNLLRKWKTGATVRWAGTAWAR